uniref:A superfamily conotoxin Vr1.2 n=1 Tax=Conus varius TaxID=89448 RepID=S4UKL6_CONVA|nr:A superfamily conotoxin Vr1.2 precursor [Conus varius]
MGMRMMFIVFLLIVLATTVVSFTSDRAFDGGNAAADMITRAIGGTCCPIPSCASTFPRLCG